MTSEAETRSSINVRIAYIGSSRVTGEAVISASFPMLSKLNHPLCAIRMEVTLEAYSLLGAIEGKSVSRKRDRRGLAVIYNVVLEDVLAQLDNKAMKKRHGCLYAR